MRHSWLNSDQKKKNALSLAIFTDPPFIPTLTPPQILDSHHTGYSPPQVYNKMPQAGQEVSANPAAHSLEAPQCLAYSTIQDKILAGVFRERGL